MLKETTIPFGPQHPVLPEPIHVDLVVEDEKVVDATPAIGYIHRGLELLVEKKEYQEFVYVAERICGICSFIHGMGYCQGVEELMGLQIPERAQFLRTFWSELSRIHSHLLWLGLAADAFGFENLFMQSWRVRELILDIVEETTGGRVIFGSAKVGGVRRDIDADTLARIGGVLESLRREVKAVTDVFLGDSTVSNRLRGIGVLSKQDAYLLGAVGPMLRASGHEIDTRKMGYAAYKDVDFDVITATEGDSYARCKVRIGEISQSFDIIRQIIEKIPDGPVEVKVTGSPPVGDALVRLEQPRGEVVYYVKSNGTKFLDRFRVRTPTFANVPSMVKIMKGATVADIPTIILTIDPCISCNER